MLPIAIVRLTILPRKLPFAMTEAVYKIPLVDPTIYKLENSRSMILAVFVRPLKDLVLLELI